MAFPFLPHQSKGQELSYFYFYSLQHFHLTHSLLVGLSLYRNGWGYVEGGVNPACVLPASWRMGFLERGLWHNLKLNCNSIKVGARWCHGTNNHYQTVIVENSSTNLAKFSSLVGGKVSPQRAAFHNLFDSSSSAI